MCTSSRSDAAEDDEDSYDYSALTPLLPHDCHTGFSSHFERLQSLAGAFFLVTLKQGPTIVCTAAMRVLGPRFAEMPFVVTRQGYRRSGNLRKLMQVGDLKGHMLPFTY